MSDAPTTSPAPAKKPRARKSARERQTLRLKLVKSGIATPKDQKATIRALGFRRIGDVVERADNPDVRGRIRKIAHLVEILSS
jgi:large subunit ribosomal protein L30